LTFRELLGRPVRIRLKMSEFTVSSFSGLTRNLEDWIISNRKTAATFEKVSVVVATITRWLLRSSLMNKAQARRVSRGIFFC